ncbi:hypothetical protein Patl1_01802 [Pistacia atlantica]|uniref:Uncharacterized protein n=1 Tax=Pistacia atlantica TaxID=434234 RepID=A0ACC1C6R5_9ROSI|nr:hypothetical protein Patl1_01802 [Pistacia atlantica]
MLNKLLKRNVPSKPAAAASQPKTISSVLKIVHIGGVVECYYMATPAFRIMEKYPSFILARPQVFRRPWDSVVRPDEILIPGEKFYLVPRRTIKKLWRRVKRPDRDRDVSMNSSMSKSSSIDVSVDVVSCKKNDFSCNSICQQNEVSKSSSSFRKKTCIKKHVRFIGIEVVKNKDAGSHNSESREQKRRPRNTFPAWEPSLDAVNERADE